MTRTNEEPVEYSPERTIMKVGVWLIVVGVLLTVLFGTFYTIGAGQRGILLTFGKPDMSAQGEGLHFKIPLVQKVVKMDIQTQKYEADLSAASKDLQTVNTKIAINYRLSAERVPEIYRDIGVTYADKVIYPLEQETNKGATALYTAEELITKREDVRQRMKDSLTEKLAPRGIIIEEVSIVNFDFSPSFNAAIEAKVTAEQNALAAKNKLAQIEYEAQQRVTQAKGEAEAIQIQVQAINAQGGKDYVQLKAIDKWKGEVPTYVGGGSPVPFINIPTSSETISSK